uniref:HPS1 biogenesis of lysosomal organelles complex 3 subunit 1 n=1 Tax=Anas platyrhynchos TaxID=8839 RepID=A0A8B9SN62_ANAPL
MRCVLIASSAAELLFYWADAAFLRRLQPPAAAAVQGPAVEDSLNTLFAPLIISCTALLEKLSDTYTCFRAEHGQHLHVLHMFGDCLYIAVNGDGTESEDDLRRTLFVLRRLVEAHCGLVTLDSHLIRKELRPGGFGAAGARLEPAAGPAGDLPPPERGGPELCRGGRGAADPPPAVRAVHRVPGEAGGAVHQRQPRARRGRGGPCLPAGAHQAAGLLLQPQHQLHPPLPTCSSSSSWCRTCTPARAPRRSSAPRSLKQGRCCLKDPREARASPVSSPGSHGASEKESDDQDTDDLSTPEVYYTPQPSPGRHSTGSESSSESPEPAAAGDADSADVQVAEDLLQTLEPLVPEASNPRRIFLDVNMRDGYCPLLPHTMHCLPLWPGISLVLLTKSPTIHVAVTLHQLLDGFLLLEKKLEEGQEVGAPRSFPFLAELRQRMDKFVKKLSGQDVQLQNAWLEFKNKIFSRSEPGSSLELLQAVGTVKRQLCSVYRQLFLSSASQSLSQGLRDRAQKLMREKLLDWRDFLLVKSRRNYHHGVVPGGLPWPGALHLRRPHGGADDGPVPQRGGEIQLGAGQGASGRVCQEQGLVPGGAGPAIPAEGLHHPDAAGRRLLLLLLPLVRERAGLQAGGDGGARPLRRLRSHRDAGRRLLQEAAALLQQEPAGRGGEVLRAADPAPGHHPLRAGGAASLRLGTAPLGAFPHPPALSRPRGRD